MVVGTQLGRRARARCASRCVRKTVLGPTEHIPQAMRHTVDMADLSAPKAVCRERCCCSHVLQMLRRALTQSLYKEGNKPMGRKPFAMSRLLPICAEGAPRSGVKSICCLSCASSKGYAVRGNVAGGHRPTRVLQPRVAPKLLTTPLPKSTSWFAPRCLATAAAA